MRKTWAFFWYQKSLKVWKNIRPGSIFDITAVKIHPHITFGSIIVWKLFHDYDLKFVVDSDKLCVMFAWVNPWGSSKSQWHRWYPLGNTNVSMSSYSHNTMLKYKLQPVLKGICGYKSLGQMQLELDLWTDLNAVTPSNSRLDFKIQNDLWPWITLTPKTSLAIVGSRAKHVTFCIN